MIRHNETESEYFRRLKRKERKMLDVGDVQTVIDKLQTRVAELEKENAKLRGNDEFWVGYHNIKSKLLR